jgi:hypothetical protein
LVSPRDAHEATADTSLRQDTRGVSYGDVNQVAASAAIQDVRGINDGGVYQAAFPTALSSANTPAAEPDDRRAEPPTTTQYSPVAEDVRTGLNQASGAPVQPRPSQCSHLAQWAPQQTPVIYIFAQALPPAIPVPALPRETVGPPTDSRTASQTQYNPTVVAVGDAAGRSPKGISSWCRFLKSSLLSMRRVRM